MSKVEQIPETDTNKNTNKSKNDKTENKKVAPSRRMEPTFISFIEKPQGTMPYTQTKQT